LGANEWEKKEVKKFIYLLDNQQSLVANDGGERVGILFYLYQ
jgi:hypothetical protein